MKAILFMMRKTLKNLILDVLHHPLKLILYIFIIAMVFFGLISMMLAPDMASTKQDIRLLEGIYYLLLTILSFSVLFSGITTGGKLFQMSDVNFLFVSPISPKKILVYGTIKQMSTVVLILFFYMVYGGMAVNNFPITAGQSALLFLGVFLAVLVSQVLALGILSCLNGNERLQKAIRGLLYAGVAYIVFVIASFLLSKGLTVENAMAAVSSPMLEYLPIIGWMKAFIFGMISGDTVKALTALLALVIGLLLSMMLIWKGRADYYEDVLQKAETVTTMKQNARDGKANNNFALKGKVRKTGLNGGWGASAFFYKHLCLIRRRSRFAWLSMSTIITTAIGVFLTLLLRGSIGGDDGLTPGLILMIICIANVYALLILNAVGEWNAELTKTSLYLVPDSPMKKVLWASMTSLVKPAVDGAIAFAVSAILLGGGALMALEFWLIYVSMAWIFTSSNLLSQRVLGSMANRGLILMLYLLLLIIMVAPGIIVTIVLAACGAPEAVLPIPIFVWNFLVSIGIFALCSKTLHNMELVEHS